MTLGEVLTFFQWAPVFAKDFSVYRESVKSFEELTVSDLTANDWVIRVGSETFTNLDDASDVDMDSVRPTPEVLDNIRKLANSTYVAEYPRGITAFGAYAVCSSILEAIPVLSSFVPCNDFNFVTGEDNNG